MLHKSRSEAVRVEINYKKTMSNQNVALLPYVRKINNILQNAVFY